MIIYPDIRFIIKIIYIQQNCFICYGLLCTYLVKKSWHKKMNLKKNYVINNIKIVN